MKCVYILVCVFMYIYIYIYVGGCMLTLTDDIQLSYYRMTLNCADVSLHNIHLSIHPSITG